MAAPGPATSSISCEILEVRPSKSRTDQGLDDAEPEQQSLFRSRSAMFPFPGEPPRTTEKSKVRNWATRNRVADLAGCSNPKVRNWASGIAQIFDGSGNLGLQGIRHTHIRSSIWWGWFFVSPAQWGEPRRRRLPLPEAVRSQRRWRARLHRARGRCHACVPRLRSSPRGRS
jgi:hypothetical protein